MGQNPGSAASFKFKGSAIYINSLAILFAPVYIGSFTDVDSVRPSRPFVYSDLFSTTNPDPSVEHSIRLSIKGPSTNRNMTEYHPNGSIMFSLINLIFIGPEFEQRPD